MRFRRLVYVNQTTLRLKEANSKAITNFLCYYQFADKNERFSSPHSCPLCFTTYLCAVHVFGHISALPVGTSYHIGVASHFPNTLLQCRCTHIRRAAGVV
jgi:hypothetical protein